VIAKFPVDSLFLTDLVRRVGKREQVDIPIGIQLLDGEGTPIRVRQGFRLELYRFGKYAWPEGRVAVTMGIPDKAGFIRTTIRLPIDAVTLRNFTLLAAGQGI
jgi:hypothetical protein